MLRLSLLLLSTRQSLQRLVSHHCHDAVVSLNGIWASSSLEVACSPSWALIIRLSCISAVAGPFVEERPSLLTLGHLERRIRRLIRTTILRVSHLGWHPHAILIVPFERDVLARGEERSSVFGQGVGGGAAGSGHDEEVTILAEVGADGVDCRLLLGESPGIGR